MELFRAATVHEGMNHPDDAAFCLAGIERRRAEGIKRTGTLLPPYANLLSAVNPARGALTTLR